MQDHKKDYGVLKPNNKGSVVLSPGWLKKNIGVEAGDLIFHAQVGPAVVLFKFDPLCEINKQLDAIAGKVPEVLENNTDTDKESV